MDGISNKLDSFVNSIRARASQEAGQIKDELTRKGNEAILQYEEQLRAETRRYAESKKSEISAREARRVSSSKNESHHALLQYREDCAKEVFVDARKRIEQFTKSELYAPHMAELLARAIRHLGYGFAADVYLRPEDMRLSQYLLDSATGVSLRFEEAAFILGGLRLVCPARGLRVDMSFDTALEDMIGHFSELSGITV